MIQAVNAEYALAKARLAATEQAMREATGQGGLNYEDSVRLRELERTAAVNKSLFEDVLQKAKITDEQSTFRPRDARVIMPAQTGGQSFPNTRKVLFTALFIGLGLGVGGAFAMEMLNTGFTTPRQVEDALGVPVLASVRRMDKSKLVSKDGKAIPYHSTTFTIRSRLSAKRFAPCEAGSICRTWIGRPRLSMSRHRVLAKAKQPLR